MGAGRAVPHGRAFLRAAALEAHRRRAAGAFGETFRECESGYRFGKGARGRTEDIVGTGVHDAGLSRHSKSRCCVLTSVLHLTLGGAAAHRSDNRPAFIAGFKPLRYDSGAKKYFFRRTAKGLSSARTK